MITQESKKNKRYLPHEVATKVGAVKLYRQSRDINFVVRRYHISKASLMRWNKQYDGTRESLEPKSHRPHRQHPNAHTEEELTWIRNYHRRNPNISVCELYGKLRQGKAYSRHPGSLYRVFIRLGYRRKVESTKKKSRHLGKYDTPAELGKKWQMDVKYVPQACYAGKDDEVFFQYTLLVKKEISIPSLRHSDIVSGLLFVQVEVNVSEITAYTVFSYGDDDFFDNLPSNPEMEAFERSFE